MALLEGSCHCGAVHFMVKSHTPQPYTRCYCTICRKTAGGGGYAVNIMAETKSFVVEGMEHVTVYQASTDGEGGAVSSHNWRHFCKRCGSQLWIWSARWPDNVYPFASAIDSDLPPPAEHTHIMLDFKADWVDLPEDSAADRRFPRFPDETIAEWHRKRGLWED